ncbi:lysis protein [Escherichia coli]|nr:lysis protein [Escherichia coli]
MLKKRTNGSVRYCQYTSKVSPSQWVAIGVLGSLLFGLLTYLTNLYFKIKEDKRKVARGE